MKRILVYEYLSGGGEMGEAQAQAPGAALLAMGQAMRDAIVADLIALKHYDVSVATCSRCAPEPAPVPSPATAVTPQPGEGPFDFVARLADAHHHVWVVAPETEGLLQRFQRTIGPARWLGCDGPSIALAASKRRTLLALSRAGVTTPLAFEHAPEITRWVVKPDDGAGALDTRLHPSLAAACEDRAQRARAGQPMVIEPWVEGAALSLSLLCSPGHTELLSVNRQHLAIDAEGWLSYEGVDVNVLPLARQHSAARSAEPGAQPHAGALQALATRVGTSLPGLCGFVGIDIVWHAQRGPVLIEVNPRVTCAYVGLSQALGRNLAAEVMVACGQPPEPVARADV